MAFTRTSQWIVQFRLDNRGLRTGAAETRDLLSSLARLDRTATGAGTGLSELGRASASTGFDLARTARQTSAAEAGFDQLAGSVRGLIGAYLGMQGVQALINMTELSTQAQAADRALQAVTGSASQATAASLALREAVNFSIPELEAEQLAASLLSRELAQNSQDLRKFAADAALVGKAFGGFTAAESIREVSSAISNFSIERLDTLGVSSAAVRDRMDELQASTAGLSREQAFGIAVMEQLAVSAGKLRASGFEAGSGMETLKSALHDAAVEASTVFGPAIDGAAEKAAAFLREGLTRGRSQREEIAALRETAKVLEELGRAAEAAALRRQAQALELGPRAGRPEVIREQAQATLEAADAQGIYNAVLTEGATAADLLSFNVPNATGAVEDLGVAAVNTADAEEILKAASEGLAEGTLNSIPAMQAMINKLLDVEETISGVSGEAERMIGILSASITAMTRVQMMGADGTFNPELRFVQGGTRDWENEAAARHVLIESQIQDTQEWFREWEKANRDAARVADKAASDAEREWERSLREMERQAEARFNSIKSAARSSLTSLSDAVDERDPLLDAFGMRRQGPSEIMRRLEDIFQNAERSPFVSQFKDLAGLADDELRAAAEALKRELASGRRLDLIPEELLLADVEAQLLAERSIEQRANQVAEKLMSKGFTEIEVDKLLDERFGVEIQQADTGAKMIASVVDSANKEIEARRAEVEAQGKAYGIAFEKGLMGQLTGFGSRFIAEVTAQVIGQITAGAQGAAG